MSVKIFDNWSFESLDYTKLIHISDTEKVKAFALEHGFSSRLGVDGTNPRFRPLSFSSKKLKLGGIDVVCILYTFLKKDKDPCFNLWIIPDNERYLNHFIRLFDIIVDSLGRWKDEVRVLKHEASEDAYDGE
ncbi:MAG TPA: hypothetical protein ENF21_09450 [Bacteroidetes bacterium]|nr:hypothetical protein [Bacteroidota bacterium]